MAKLDNLENKFEKVINNASLKNNKEQKTKNRVIYNIPVEWLDILKQQGFSFSSYAKIAILEKMKKDELI